MRLKSPVTATTAATPEAALAHFEARLTFETDCWDVHYAIHNDLTDFVLLDVRFEHPISTIRIIQNWAASLKSSE